MADIYRDNYIPIAAKTANYTVVPGDLGKLFTNRGAGGAVTLTLPFSTSVSAGWWFRFAVVADQSFTIATPTGDTDIVVAFNDNAADSIAVSTAAKKVGAASEVVFDGTGWLVFFSGQNDGTNFNLLTVAT